MPNQRRKKPPRSTGLFVRKSPEPPLNCCNAEGDLPTVLNRKVQPDHCRYFVAPAAMNRPFASFLLVYYACGAFLLGGNFSLLADLPAMYTHCKATEDKDMTPLDFITDHLVNVDALFDRHPAGDEQRPHSGKDQQHIGSQPYTPLSRPHMSLTALRHAATAVCRGEIPDGYHFEFSALVFRPPCA